MATTGAGRGQKAAQRRPRTRLGGDIRLYVGGREITEAELAAAVQGAGWRPTEQGPGYLEGLRDAGKVA